MSITIDFYPSRYIYIKIGNWDWIWERQTAPVEHN